MKAILNIKRDDLWYPGKEYISMTKEEKMYWISRLKTINEEDKRCLELLLENECKA